MTQVHKVTLMIIDHDGVGADGVASTLEETRYPNRCIGPQVYSVETEEIGEWADNNALNTASWAEEFERLFSAMKPWAGYPVIDVHTKLPCGCVGYNLEVVRNGDRVERVSEIDVVRGEAKVVLRAGAFHVEHGVQAVCQHGVVLPGRRMNDTPEKGGG